MSNFEKVGKFMKTFGQEVKNKAKFPEEKIVKLRYDLIAEELEEFKVAFKKIMIQRGSRRLNGYFLCYLWSWSCFWYKFR